MSTQFFSETHDERRPAVDEDDPIRRIELIPQGHRRGDAAEPTP